MKKKLVAFAVTAAMVITSAVPAFAVWEPSGAQDMPETNEVVIDSTHLKAGIENPLGGAIASGAADSITVDFNRTKGNFAYNITLVTNKNVEQTYSAKMTNGTVNVNKVGDTTVLGSVTGVSGIATLTWRFDTTDAEKPFIELAVDMMNTNKDPEPAVVRLSVEPESVVKTVVKAAGAETVPAGSQIVLYQNQIPSKVVDVELIKTDSIGNPLVDKYGNLQFVDQPVLGETYTIYSITFDDKTVISNYYLDKDGSYKWNSENDVNKYVNVRWVVTNPDGTEYTATKGQKLTFLVKNDYKGKFVTLEVSGNKTSGIFDSVTWGANTDPLAVQERIAGENRFETAMAVADNMDNAGKFKTIFVADGTEYADALSATSLANYFDAPILLVNGKTGAYEDEVAAYIEENAANYNTKVYIVGGEKAVSDSFADKLYKMNYDVERLAGENRYETNLAILEAYKEEAGVKPFAKVLVATGKNYADALTASVTGCPILLVGDNVTVAQRDFLQSFTNTKNGTYKVGEYVIIGGTSAVKPSIKNVLSGKGFVASADDVTRIGGVDRYATNRLIVNKLMNGAKSADYVFVATGNNFADALTGGVLAAENNSPLVLVSETKTQVAKNIVKNVGPKYGFVVLGGENAVSNATVQKIA